MNPPRLAEEVVQYWRIITLVVLVAASLTTLLIPVGPTAGNIDSDGPPLLTESDRVTTLQYDIALSGGVRVRAPLAGYTAEGVTVERGDTSELGQRVADELPNVTVSEVTVRIPKRGETQDSGAIEVTKEGVSKKQFRAALEAAGVEYNTIRSGVTRKTREQTVNVLNDKLSEAGFSGGTARTVTTPTGTSLILIEAPNRNVKEIIELVESRGKVEVVAYYPVEVNGKTEYRTEVILEKSDLQRVGVAQKTRQQGAHVPVSVAPSSAERVRNEFIETGVASEGGTRCAYRARPESTPPCLLTVVDGEVVYSAGMSPGLAESIRNGEWVQNPQFILQTQNISEARELAINLRAGSLPAKLDIGDGNKSVSFVSSTQGDRFKRLSFIIGLLSVLAVSMKIYVQYRSLAIAAPMLATALSEVVILLGIAAALRYPIDLATVAGLIAVVGTGVDDLIIIANDTMVNDSSNLSVFNNRFRKALWVILAAAGTTIIAMTPLAFLSLGDLRGFAIFTILGVIIGVTITRPAYGDILRYLTTDE